MAATKFRGTVYLYAFDTENDRKRKAKETEFQDRMCFWGRKFEQYIVSGGQGAVVASTLSQSCKVLLLLEGNRRKVHKVCELQRIFVMSYPQ